MKVGFIGAGRMGRPMVTRLMAEGHDVTVLVRRAEAQAEAEAEGLTCVGTVDAAVRDADLVVVVVLNDEQVRETCLGPDGALAAMKSGATIVQHTTCDPATIELVATECVARGLKLLDAAVSGGPHDIAAGTLTLWVGGDRAVLDLVESTLAAYASPILHVGPVGNGQRVKLVNNALFVAQVGLAIDAVRIAESLGVSEQTILVSLQHGSGASRALGVVAQGGSVDAVASRLASLMSKDVAMVRQVALSASADLGIIGAVLSSDAVERKILHSTQAMPAREDG